MYQLKPITPKKLGMLDPKVATRVIDNVITQTSVAIHADFGVTTQTWKKRPTFLIKRTKEGAIIYTTNLIYHFVSGGTRVRYATMTPDFRAKTRVAQIMSGAGRGGMMFVSKKHPRPGIKARKFPEVIAEKWNKETPNQFKRAVETEQRAAAS